MRSKAFGVFHCTQMEHLINQINSFLVFPQIFKGIIEFIMYHIFRKNFPVLFNILGGIYAK